MLPTQVQALTGVFLSLPDAALALSVGTADTLPPPYDPELRGRVRAGAGAPVPMEPVPVSAPAGVRPLLTLLAQARVRDGSEWFPRQRDRDFVSFLSDVRAGSAEPPGRRTYVLVSRPQVLRSGLVREWVQREQATILVPPDGVQWLECVEVVMAAAWAGQGHVYAVDAAAAVARALGDFEAAWRGGHEPIGWVPSAVHVPDRGGT